MQILVILILLTQAIDMYQLFSIGGYGVIPNIVWAEVRYGICKKGSIKLQKSAESLAKMIRIVPFNQQTADIYAQLRAAMEKQGKNLSPMDMLIAASAVANHCVLVTNDQAFLQVETLPVEDWTV